MIEAFANESETANIDNENPTALIASTLLLNDKDQTGQVEDIAHFIIFTYRQDENWLISTRLQHTQPEYSGEDGPS